VTTQSTASSTHLLGSSQLVLGAAMAVHRKVPSSAWRRSRGRRPTYWLSMLLVYACVIESAGRRGDLCLRQCRSSTKHARARNPRKVQ
jgi:hypothetical protein